MTPFYYQGETPLHLALRIPQQNKINNIRILVEAGANLDLPANYPGRRKITARELMQGRPEYVEILKEAGTSSDKPKETEKNQSSVLGIILIKLSSLILLSFFKVIWMKRFLF